MKPCSCFQIHRSRLFFHRRLPGCHNSRVTFQDRRKKNSSSRRPPGRPSASHWLRKHSQADHYRGEAAMSTYGLILNTTRPSPFKSSPNPERLSPVQASFHSTTVWKPHRPADSPVLPCRRPRRSARCQPTLQPALPRPVATTCDSATSSRLSASLPFSSHRSSYIVHSSYISAMTDSKLAEVRRRGSKGPS